MTFARQPFTIRSGGPDIPTSGQGRHAFTMVEMVVVIVVLSVAAGLIIPRMAGRSSRSAEAEVKRIAVALNATVRRAVNSSQRTAMAFDRDTSRISVQVAKPREIKSFDMQPAEWQDDAMEPAFTLEHVQFVSGTTDEFPLDPSGWRLEFSPEFKRPEIGMVFQSIEGQDRWRIRLESSSMASTITYGDGAGAGNNVVDLDAIGQRDSAW